MKDISNTWKYRYFRLAKEISTWSKDPSTQVGAVCIGNKGQLLSQGYNGFPRSFDDNKDLYENRQVKYKYIVHAEMNCIYHATLNGVCLEDSSLFVYGLDICSECAKAIVQVGIKQVFTCSKPIVSDYWRESFVITEDIFKKGDIYYEKYDYESLSKYTG